MNGASTSTSQGLGPVNLTATVPGSADIASELAQRLNESRDPANRLNGIRQFAVNSWVDILPAFAVLQGGISPAESNVILNVDDGQTEKRDWCFKMNTLTMRQMISEVCENAVREGEISDVQLAAILRQFSIQREEPKTVRVCPLFDLRSGSLSPLDPTDPSCLSPEASTVFISSAKFLAGSDRQANLVIATDSANARAIRDSIVPVMDGVATDESGLSAARFAESLRFLMPPVSPNEVGQFLTLSELDEYLRAQERRDQQNARNEAVQRELATLKGDPAKLEAFLAARYPGHKTGTVTHSFPTNPATGKDGYCFVKRTGEGPLEVKIIGRSGTESREGYFLNIIGSLIPSVTSATNRSTFGPQSPPEIPEVGTEVFFLPCDEHPAVSTNRLKAARMEVEYFCDLDELLRAHLAHGAI